MSCPLFDAQGWALLLLSKYDVVRQFIRVRILIIREMSAQRLSDLTYHAGNAFCVVSLMKLGKDQLYLLIPKG